MKHGDVMRALSEKWKAADKGVYAAVVDVADDSENENDGSAAGIHTSFGDEPSPVRRFVLDTL